MTRILNLSYYDPKASTWVTLSEYHRARFALEALEQLRKETGGGPMLEWVARKMVEGLTPSVRELIEKHAEAR